MQAPAGNFNFECSDLDSQNQSFAERMATISSQTPKPLKSRTSSVDSKTASEISVGGITLTNSNSKKFDPWNAVNLQNSPSRAPILKSSNLSMQSIDIPITMNDQKSKPIGKPKSLKLQSDHASIPIAKVVSVKNEKPTIPMAKAMSARIVKSDSPSASSKSKPTQFKSDPALEEHGRKIHMATAVTMENRLKTKSSKSSEKSSSSEKVFEEKVYEPVSIDELENHIQDLNIPSDLEQLLMPLPPSITNSSQDLSIISHPNIANHKQFGLIGHANKEKIYLNTAVPFCMVAVGVQGAGKSHSLATIIENCTINCEPFIRAPKPISTIIFHYDQGLCR